MKMIDETEIVQALHDGKGNITNAAKRLGISRMTLYEKMKKDENLRTELQHAREQLCDLAENVIYEQLEQGSLKAAIFVLQHLGRKKNLSENPEKEILLGDFTGFS